MRKRHDLPPHGGEACSFSHNKQAFTPRVPPVSTRKPSSTPPRLMALRRMDKQFGSRRCRETPQHGLGTGKKMHGKGKNGKTKEEMIKRTTSRKAPGWTGLNGTMTK